jgi:hypothetical protein
LAHRGSRHPGTADPRGTGPFRGTFTARFSAAQKAGKFKDEIVDVEVRGKKGVEAFAVDEAPRPDTTVEVLAKLRPACREDGTITAGNDAAPLPYTRQSGVASLKSCRRDVPKPRQLTAAAMPSAGRQFTNCSNSFSGRLAPCSRVFLARHFSNNGEKIHGA